jgi:DNA-binding CsgD family transcriptional regulator
MEQQFSESFASSRVAMLVLDDNAVYADANDAACRALGRRRDAILGHELGFSSDPARRRELRELWAGFRDTGFVVSPWQYTVPGGRPVDVEAMCFADALGAGRHLSLYWPRLPEPAGRGLSPREEEITRLLARGLTGEQIAQRLYLSPETVRTHVRNAMVRLRAQTRAQLVAVALERGLISLDP